MIPQHEIPTHEWLRWFDREELERMIAELAQAPSMEELTALVHEWKESADAAGSDVLAEAFAAPQEEE